MQEQEELLFRREHQSTGETPAPHHDLEIGFRTCLAMLVGLWPW